MSYSYNTDQGIISADTSDIQSTVESEWRTNLNAPNLVVVASSLQGTMIAAEVLTRKNIQLNNAEQANLINPNYSYGVALDALCALLGVTRGSDAYTSVTGVQFNGSSVDNDVVIPSGTRLKTAAGDTFVTSTSITIPAGAASSVTGTIQASVVGDVAAAVGSLTIVDGTIGFASASILSTSVVTLGTTEMSDAQLKVSRNKRLFAQGIQSPGAIQAHLLAVDNVTSVNVIENITGQYATAVNDVTFTMNYGVWVCVYGSATDADIAAALWAAHGGSPFDYGASGQGTQVDSPDGTATTDPYSGVEYYVKFVRATEKTAYIKATLKRGTSTATSSAITTAMTDYANGDIDGEEGLVIGADVSAYEFAGAITNSYPGVFVKKVEVAVTDSGATAPADADYSDLAEINPWEIAILSSTNISLEFV